MITPPRFRLRRVFRFLKAAALDFLIPDAVEKVWKLCLNFHQNFLVIDLAERLEVYRELDQVSPDDEAELAELIYAKWAEQVPPSCPLPPEARRVAEQLVRA